MSSKYDDLDEELKNLVFDFFYWFSRFEYALKMELPKVKGPGESAQANWNEFRTKHESEYVVIPALTELLDEPPSREIYIEGGASTWQELTFGSTESELGKAIKVVKTIRNNLFHGGKACETGWDDPDRIRFLLPRGVKVLHSFAALDQYGTHYSYQY